MRKHIVVCFDGCWNRPERSSLVFDLFQLLGVEIQTVTQSSPLRPHLRIDELRQTAFYLPAHDLSPHAVEFGSQLAVNDISDRLIDAFVLVSQEYQVGDKIWIFGFSQGAWAARSLAQLLARVGILDDACSADAVKRAEWMWMASKHAGYQSDYWVDKDAYPIKMVGVWDTVGELGIPEYTGEKPLELWDKKRLEFLDLNLDRHVEFGRQALALDETRNDYTPAFWNNRQGIVQAWFAGSHGDLGGIHGKRKLSNISLLWMIEQINQLQTSLQIPIPSIEVDVAANRHDDSQLIMWKLRPKMMRNPNQQHLIHESIVARLRQRHDYRPLALLGRPEFKEYFAEYTTPPHTALQREEVTDSPAMIMRGRKLQIGDCLHFNLRSDVYWNATRLAVRPGEIYRIEMLGDWLAPHEAQNVEYGDASNVLEEVFVHCERFGSNPQELATIEPRERTEVSTRPCQGLQSKAQTSQECDVSADSPINELNPSLNTAVETLAKLAPQVWRMCNRSEQAPILSALQGGKRIPQADWLMPVAAIYHGIDLESLNGLTQPGYQNKIRHIDKESQLNVANDQDFQVDQEGYLYLFANNLPFAYDTYHAHCLVCIHRVK